MAGRFLIVNADDFGRATAINEGIVKGHQEGIVTAASLMVRWPAASEAASYSRGASGLSVGLHVDLGEWVYTGGQWVARYQVTAMDDAEAITHEVARQLDRFRSLMGRDPSHLDTHQHTHRHEPASSVLRDFGARLDLPLRDHSLVRYDGGFYGQDGRGEPYPQGITVEALLAILDDLPEGWTELGCHPALGSDLDDVYAVEREEELMTLCAPEVRSGLAARGIELRTFDDVSVEVGKVR